MTRTVYHTQAIYFFPFFRFPDFLISRYDAPETIETETHFETQRAFLHGASYLLSSHPPCIRLLVPGTRNGGARWHFEIVKPLY